MLHCFAASCAAHEQRGALVFYKLRLFLLKNTSNSKALALHLIGTPAWPSNHDDCAASSY
jgi:hypothetical protein